MFSQTDLNNWGAVINIQPDADIYISGDLVINDAENLFLPTTRNTGTIHLQGDLINNSITTMFLNEGRPGPIVFEGDKDQSIQSSNDIYLPSIFLDKNASSDLILELDVVRVDSTIQFNSPNSGNILVGDASIIMETNGVIIGERASSRLIIENGNLEVEFPTLAGINEIYYHPNYPFNLDSALYIPPDELYKENLFGIGWGIIYKNEDAKGKDGEVGVRVLREGHYHPQNGQAQVANGVTAKRLYRMNSFQNGGSLRGVVLHYFESDLEDLPKEKSKRALYVSNDDGVSWTKMRDGTFASDSTITYTVENIPIQQTKENPNASNLFVVAEAECNSDANPKTNIALFKSSIGISGSNEIYEINICDGDSLGLKYDNSDDTEYRWLFDSDSLVAENNQIAVTSVSAANKGIYTIELKNNKGCETFRQVRVNVWGEPQWDANGDEPGIGDGVADFFGFDPTDACVGEPINFNISIAEDQGKIVKYDWFFTNDTTTGQTVDVSEGEVVETPVFDYDSVGTYTVKLIAESEYGCVATFTDRINIHPNPTAEFEMTEVEDGIPITYVCSGEEFYLDPSDDINFLNSKGSFVDFTWDFGDGNTLKITQPQDSNPDLIAIGNLGEHSHHYSVTRDTTFTITLTVGTSRGCAISTSQDLRIFAQPDALFEMKYDGVSVNESCVGFSISFERIQEQEDESSYRYFWDFGTGENESVGPPETTYTFNTTGAYDVALRVQRNTTDCGTTFTQKIEILDSPKEPYSEQLVFCGSSKVLDAAHNASENLAPGTTYRWLDADDDNKLLSNAQQYTVSSSTDDPINLILEVENTIGCFISQPIEVTLNADIAIDLGPDKRACESVIIGNDQFQEANYVWTKEGNPDTISTQPMINVTNSGTYTVTVTADSDCSDTASGDEVATDEIVVTIDALPAVTLGEDRQICRGTLETLRAGEHSSYSWSDGSTGPSVTVSATGTYWVKVINENGCEARAEVFIEVVEDEIETGSFGATIPCDPGCLGKVDASFRMIGGSGSNETCAFTEVQFISAAAELDPTAYDFAWSFGDGSISQEPSPLKAFSGDKTLFNVTLSVTSKVDGCNAVSSDNFTVLPTPRISINETVTTCGDHILLDAENVGSSYRWIDLASGDVLSTSQAYEVSSTSKVPIEIVLEISNPAGCTASQNIQVALNADLGIDLGPDTTACESIIIGSNEFPSATYLWSTGETTSTIEVTNSGTYSVEITEPENGCASMDEIVVQVRDLPVPNLENTLSLCLGEVKNVNPGSFASYLWSDGSTDNSFNIGSAGLYWVEVSDAWGCTNRDTLIARITDDEVLDLPEEIQLCNAVFELDAGVDALSYLWGSSNGFESTGKIISINEAGTYWVEAIGECIQKDTVRAIQSTDQLAPSFLIPSIVGVGDFVNIVQLTDPLPEQSFWLFGDRNFSRETNPIYQYSEVGEYTITLQITNGGCTASTSKSISVVASRFEAARVSQELIEVLKLKAYPNPIIDHLNIELEVSTQAPILVRVFTMTGLEVYRNEFEEEQLDIPIDLSNQNSGLYVVSVQVGRENRLLKIVKPE